MNILIDINHPAHVHFFKYTISALENKGHKVRIIGRNKDVVMDLLEHYNLPYIKGTTRKEGIFNLGLEFIQKIKLITTEGRKFKPDLILSIGSPPASWASKILNIPHITFDDTEHQWEQHLFYAPFSTLICTPSCFQKDFGKKQLKYDGYHELAYLHPNRFKPDNKILGEIGLDAGNSYFIVRFVSWQASHDLGEHGFSNKGKEKLVEQLGKIGRVFISSEGYLPSKFEPFRLIISPAKIHDLLYYSCLYIGEGASMASEAAVLGVPSIYVNTITAGTLEEQEKKYKLLYRVSDEENAIAMAVRISKDENVHPIYRKRAELMVKEKIDVTDWIVKLIEGFEK